MNSRSHIFCLIYGQLTRYWASHPPPNISTFHFFAHFRGFQHDRVPLIMGKNIFYLFLFLILSERLPAQEVPKVLHFTKNDYQGHFQNWDISQRKDLQLFFGNTSGLLKYDGTYWHKYALPSKQAVRAIHCGKDGKVFVGGFAAIGYWQANKNGKLDFTSLLEKVKEDSMGNEEIWHILPMGDKILFQSFSTLFIYDNEEIIKVRPPDNVMFARKIGDKIFIPTISKGIFEYKNDGSFDLVAGSEIFGGKKIATILPSSVSSMLVCTQNDGIYQQVGRTFVPWNCEVNNDMKSYQLNKAIQLSNSDFVFGTILNGLFVTDKQGNLKHHINQENGLQNNTVLSLFEDQAHELWVGLDKGIDLVVLDSPLQYFQDKTGEIGAVYAASLFKGNMYIGSNQGIFLKKYPEIKDKGFQLLPGSQGQVWDLQVFDGQLIAGLNNGSATIEGQKMGYLFTSTGVYTTIPHPERLDVLLQGSYTGINILKKSATGRWYFSNIIEGAEFSAYKLSFDNWGHLWVIHPKKGLYRLTLDPALKKAEKIELYSKEKGLPSDFNLDLINIGGEMIIKSDSLFFTLEEASGIFKQKKVLGKTKLEPGNFRLIGGRTGEWFQVLPFHTSFYHGNVTNLRISLITGNERIIPLETVGYLFCLDDGYAILPYQNDTLATKKMPPPLITGIEIGQNQFLDEPENLSLPLSLQPSNKQIRIFYTSPNFTFRPSMRTRLIGFDEKWSAYLPVFSKEFTNLAPGEYVFQVQGEESEAIASFRFSIEPHWYQTIWAMVGYVLLLSAFGWLLVHWHSRRMRNQMEHLQIEKEKELEQQRMHANNQLLQSEIQNKNRKLADTTMNLVRKNEMLLKIKRELEKTLQKREDGISKKSLLKLEHLIEEHLTSEEDWSIFESNFNQLHDQFFKRLKENYPDLTPGDLRLAAYLKMNLSSKEIAPLLNISVRGIENKRYRLRTKMNLDNEVNLTEFLMEF